MRRVALVALTLLLAPPVEAGTEEFSTFSVIAQEEDDESLIDHLLTRPPRDWSDEWERSSQALRSSQGCLTSGQWFIDTRLKLQAPLGERARFGLDLRDQQSDRATLTYFDFWFRFPTRFGTPGVWFRPLFDKSRQDLGVFWEAGAETASAHARLTFGFEDVFNNLWEFRQSRVGETSEPYEKHPFEPAFRMHVKGSRVRVALEGQVLTPSRRRIAAPGAPPRHAGLWGTWGRASLAARALGLWWSVSGENRQAKSTEPFEVFTVPLDLARYRRQWSIEAEVAGAIGDHWDAELRWIHQGRDEIFSGDGSLYYPRTHLDAVDRVAQVEVRRRIGSRWAARAGAMIDVITVDAADAAGSPPASFATYGSRHESRAYLGLSGRFGRVTMSVVEGIELDHEPYEVWGVHDKAFAHLQTTF